MKFVGSVWILSALWDECLAWCTLSPLSSKHPLLQPATINCQKRTRSDCGREKAGSFGRAVELIKFQAPKSDFLELHIWHLNRLSNLYLPTTDTGLIQKGATHECLETTSCLNKKTKIKQINRLILDRTRGLLSKKQEPKYKKERKKCWYFYHNSNNSEVSAILTVVNCFFVCWLNQLKCDLILEYRVYN